MTPKRPCEPIAKPVKKARRPPVAKGKGAKAKATRLHSLIIRSRRVCEVPECTYECHCDNFPEHRITCRLETAHIIPRGACWTRTDLENAFCLCSSHHARFTGWPDEWMAFVDSTIGREAFDDLKTAARIGVGKKFDWAAEVERLEPIWKAIKGDL